MTAKTLFPALLAATLAAGLAVPGVAQQAGPDVAPGPALMFDAADADGDGKVTPDELRQLRANRAASLDADGDGFLTEAELTAFHQAQAAERIAARVARQIERFDADGDGRLSVAELGAGPGPRWAPALFERADTDGDGAVSREEFDTFREARAERRGDHGPRWLRRGHGGDWH